MITNTPIASLLEVYTYTDMQMYVIAMIALVAVMTILDLMHKKSAQYFFDSAKKAQENATKNLSAGDKMGIAVKTVVVDVATSGEFKNPVRRLVHLLTMYGFILFNATTAMMIFGESATDTALTTIWHIGAIMLFVGSFWFWLVFKVDVAAEGNSWFNINIKRDMFSLSLMATSTTALIWSATNGGTGLWFNLVILATVSLFGGVYWSKFAHMFFKPAAAYNKRIVQADGSNENLPTLNRDDPEQQKRHSMELLVDAPMNMGLGIKREKPNHY